ncbi:hypothetical protein WA026_021333 [Henosepilachna vigintioctopunctata]|uniref:Uncharacterized protein n=1 Tax=Henosepilachna vigintioctopunctata TaxID=420089 RepID=A0AAW1U6X1_9CUCU
MYIRFNSKHTTWNSGINITSGNLHKQISDQDMNTIIDASVNPTIFPFNGNRPDVIDVCILKDITDKCESTEIQETSSEQNPVLLELRTRHIIENTENLVREVKHLTGVIQRVLRETKTKEENLQKDKIRGKMEEVIDEKLRARRQPQRTLHPEDEEMVN